MLEFIYVNQVKLNNEVVFELLNLTDQYEITDLKNLCEDFISKNVTITNLSEVAQAAEKFKSTLLKESVLTFITNNVSIIEENRDSLNLPEKYFWDVIFKLGKKLSSS